MDDEVRTALASDPLIDITTTGRKTGQPRRIEIGLIHAGNDFYLSATPDRPRNWFANLRANPRFTVHLKESMQRDLEAEATPIMDADERRQFFERLLRGRWSQFAPQIEDWIARSPLVLVRFED